MPKYNVLIHQTDYFDDIEVEDEVAARIEGNRRLANLVKTGDESYKNWSVFDVVLIDI